MKAIVQTLIDALGAGSVRFGDAIEPRYLGDWSGRSPVPPLAVVLPRSTDEVATVLRLCNEARQSVVPQGGMTGLAGGAIPPAAISACRSNGWWASKRLIARPRP